MSFDVSLAWCLKLPIMLSDFTDYAMTFQALVSLFGLWVQERRADKDEGVKEFGDWLAEHHFDDLKKRLIENRDLQTGIAKLLRADHAEILETLRGMDRVLVSIAGKLDGFKEISQAVGATPEISEQADWLLTRLYQSGATTLFHAEYDHGAVIMMLSNRAAVEALEPQLAGDDLRTLERFGLLHSTPGGEGYDYRLTRDGIRYLSVKGVKREASDPPAEPLPQ